MVGRKTSSRMSGGRKCRPRSTCSREMEGLDFFPVEGVGAGRCIFFRSFKTPPGRDPVEPTRTRTTLETSRTGRCFNKQSAEGTGDCNRKRTFGFGSCPS